VAGTHELLVASNRGPLSLVPGENGRDAVRRGGGGLVSGMSSALASSGGLWICAALNDRERAAARRAGDGTLGAAGVDTGDLEVRMLPLDVSTFNRAYNGVANSTVWFVNHMLFDTPNRPVFDAGWRRLWAAYERYNAAFADALAGAAAPSAKAMVQDYHLFLTPRLLRERRPDLRITHFTHTPWAPPDYYAVLPDDIGRSIITGLLGADHIGFHSPRWADAFLACCRELLDCAVPPPTGSRRSARRSTAASTPPRRDSRLPLADRSRRPQRRSRPIPRHRPRRRRARGPRRAHLVRGPGSPAKSCTHPGPSS
jgi:trehalose 6-phosphate synthase